MGRIETGVQEGYETAYPSDDLSIRLFDSYWSSAVPGFEHLTGKATLFEDPRINWFVEKMGGCHGLSVLDLGPLEGAHSYMFAKAGANVLAIEANRNAFLRCLVIKELFGFANCRFKLGNFEAFLNSTTQRFDVINCCGVLYHLTDPLVTLQRIVSLTDIVCLWSMFYDEAQIGALPAESPGRCAFTGESEIREIGPHKIRYHYRSYYGTSHGPRFSGGYAPGSVWVERKDVADFLQAEGFEIDIAFENLTEFGPAAAVFARRAQ